MGVGVIIVTGGAGFIGSNIVKALNQRGREDIIIVDHLGTGNKWRNLRPLTFADYLERDDFFSWMGSWPNLDAVIHMGACTRTDEKDVSFLIENNTRFTQKLAEMATARGFRMIYASSAATYGDGEGGYDDDVATLHHLRPLNPYAYSKHLFDLKAKRMGWFKEIVGLKFFNVFGPGEEHKGGMSSVVSKAYQQIRDTGRMRLFRSHRDDIADGDQRRDFIHVNDVVAAVLYFLGNHKGGLFNVGTGRPTSFAELTRLVFQAMGKPEHIDYIDMPPALSDTYQYFTRAETEKLRKAGFKQDFTPLDQAVTDYVHNHLMLQSPSNPTMTPEPLV